MTDTESNGEHHDMHAPFKSPEAKAARELAEAAAPNPSPHRGLRFYKTKSGKGRVKARHMHTDDSGKRRQQEGPAHGWGMRIIIEGKCVTKTKEMAQNEAAHDHDNFKNEHEGRGLGELPTGKRAKYCGECNYPATPPSSTVVVHP
jgi:hypothetical protein